MKWKKRGASSSIDAPELERESLEYSTKSTSVDSARSSLSDGDATEEKISNCLNNSSDAFQSVLPVGEKFSTEKLIHI